MTSLRGQSSEVFATPDGKLEAREYLRPVRARVDGQWRPIDADLATTGDGMVAPKVATVQLEFSGGGDEPMVRLEKAGRKLELTWPGGDLPQPQLNGATATYPEVLPGVDLRLTAQADGFAQLLVVKTAEAAKSSALAELRLGLNTAGISVKETVQGGLAAVDEGAKTPIFEASKPLMWDSSGGSATETTAKQTDTASSPSGAVTAAADEGDEPSATESGNLASVDVEVSAGQDELVLTPDAEVMHGADTEYPVFIDPQWYSPRASAWTMVSRYWASSPQWKFNGESDSGMGFCGWAYCEPQDLKRLFYRIPTTRFAGKDIISAEFVVRNTHSASCTDREVQLWRTKGINSSTTWNTQLASGFWIDKLATKSFAYGYSGCAAKDAEFSVRSAVQEAADKDWSSITFGLKATSESDRLTWKRFSDKAYLRVKYNRPPYQVKMSQLAMQYGGVCKEPGEKARVRTLGHLYANNIKDPDGDNVAVQFRADWGGSPKWTPARTSFKRSGSSFSVSMPTVPENVNAHWYVRVYDGESYSPWSWAGSPTACYFVYDTDEPAAPSISSGEFPESNPEDPNDPWYDGVGRYGYFTLNSPDSDVNRYWYGINGDPSAKHEVKTASGAPQVVKVLPGQPGLNFITAMSFDEAGNASSEIHTYQFRVRAGQPERATWQFDEDADATEAKGSTPPRTADIHGGVTPGVQGVVGTAASFNGTDGYAATDIPVINTRRGFTVSAWVKIDHKPDRAAIIAAQPGNYSPGFELYYSAVLDRWVFNHYEADDPDAEIVRAMADQPGGVEVGQWTHLVGSYDGVEKHLQLYVNGKLVGQTDHPNAWEARRGLIVGAGSYSGQVANFFPGTIDELDIFDKRIAQSEVDTLYAKKRVGDPGRPAIAIFPMDESVDAAELTAHGDVLPAVFHGGVTTGAAGVDGHAITLNGSDGYARVASPHFNSSRSFSVSAWVKIDHKTNVAAIIAAQTGNERPGFELYYSASYDRWVFNQYDTDSAESSPIRAMADTAGGVYPGSWAHLVGVHDTVADTLTLYVDGSEVGSTKLGGAFYAAGPLQIGAGNYSGEVSHFFPGQIDDIRLFDRPVSAEEVHQLYAQRPIVKGRWMFEQVVDGTPSTTPDDSATDDTMSLYNGAKAGPGFIDFGGLELDGVDDYGATGAVPVDTTGSFTVTAWAQASSTPQDAVSLVSADGSRRSALSVRYVPDPTDPQGLGSWQLALPDQDADDASVPEVSNGNFYDVRDWNHLAVVYDGFAKSVRLYVNGNLEEVACQDTDGDGTVDDPTCTDLVPWAENALSFKATGSLQVGRAKTAGAWGEYFPGLVDDVWAFQGALTDAQIEKLASSWFDVPTQVPGD